MTLKRRSNRPLTQFACGCLDVFLLIENYETDRSKGNTSVKCYNHDDARVFQVALNGIKILEAVFFGNQPITFCAIFDTKFKIDENFRSIAIERLNGLLDSFSLYQIIPPGIRVFRDREEDAYFLGRGNNRFALSENTKDQILIDTDYRKLSMEKL